MSLRSKTRESGAVTATTTRQLCTEDTILETLLECKSSKPLHDEHIEFELPVWFDADRYRRGAELFEHNTYTMFKCKMAGLLTLLAIPSIVKILVLTNKSGNPAAAFRRYVDTIRHMIYWYRADLTDPKSPGRESLLVVRDHHNRASASAQRAGLYGIFQRDLALTQFAFCGYVVLRRKELNMVASEEELLDFLHFWRTIGYIMGIEDSFNLCQLDDLRRTDRLFSSVCSRILAPALQDPPEQFEHMSRVLCEGMWCMMPFLRHDTFLTVTQVLAGVPPERVQQPTSWYGRLLLQLINLVATSLGIPLFGDLLRLYHNNNIRFGIFMSTHYPLLGWYAHPGNSLMRYHKLISSLD